MRAAARLARGSELITTDIVEISEYPHLAVKYNVRGVPHTVVNEAHQVVGALPEAELIAEIASALDSAGG